MIVNPVSVTLIFTKIKLNNEFWTQDRIKNEQKNDPFKILREEYIRYIQMSTWSPVSGTPLEAHKPV